VPGHLIEDCPALAQERRERGARKGEGIAAVKRDQCWFCLASPDVEAHLIVSVGTHFYVAADKGPLADGHMLLLPIQHVASLVELPREADAELETLMSAVQRCYAASGCGAMFYERNLATRGPRHMHVQCVPVPLAQLAAAHAAWIEQGRARRVAFEPLPEGQDLRGAVGNAHYISVRFSDGRRLLHLQRGSQPDDNATRFPRDVCAQIVGAPERANWQASRLAPDKEAAMVTALKERFKPFDPFPSD
jgi:diadenosine tetraphosphate (Ap4A) HIT family hydrolase